MFKTILLIEKDEILKEFFSRVFYIDGFEVQILNNEEEIESLSEREVQSIDLILIDECDDPSTFSNKFREIRVRSEKGNIPILGILKKGDNPDEAQQNFDAVMIKDNFNIQLLTDLVERLTS